MITYEYLKEKNSDKLERINAPKEGVEVAYLVFDVDHPYENSITKFRKTDLYEEGERNGIHGLHCGTVIKQINPKAILYGQSYTFNFDSVVDFCIKENIRVINTSITCSYSRKRNEAIKRYADWGGIVVGASGNWEGHSVSYPADMDCTIAVSATNTEDTNGEEVDVSVESWWKTKQYNHDRFMGFSGTSGAAPVIGGVATHYLEANPNGNVTTFRSWLKRNSYKQDELDFDIDGKLEKGERFFAFPDNLVDKEK